MVKLWRVIFNFFFVLLPPFQITSERALVSWSEINDNTRFVCLLICWRRKCRLSLEGDDEGGFKDQMEDVGTVLASPSLRLWFCELLSSSGPVVWWEGGRGPPQAWWLPKPLDNDQCSNQHRKCLLPMKASHRRNIPFIKEPWCRESFLPAVKPWVPWSFNVLWNSVSFPPFY